MSLEQNISTQETEIQQLDDWEILDEIFSSRSVSPVLVPTPPPPPPPPYSHLPAWLYTQICAPIQQQQEEEEVNDRPIFVARPLNKVRELQESFFGVPGFEDIPLAENKQSEQQFANNVLHSSVSVGRLVNVSGTVSGGFGKSSSTPTDSFMMLASDLKTSKSLSDLTLAKDNSSIVHVPEDKENFSPKSAMTILLMGDSVESWASVGNKIIGLNVFAASSHNSSHPLRLQRASVTRNNTRITLVTIPVLKPMCPLPPSLKAQITSLLQAGVDAILMAGGWYGSLETSVDTLLKHVRNVAGDEAADHVLMLLRRPKSGSGSQEEDQEDKKGSGEGEPCVQQIVQQAATRTLTVSAWEGMTEKQINKVVDMAYKLSINQGKLKVSCADNIPLRKWPDLCSSKKFEYVMVQRGGGCNPNVSKEGICKLVGNARGWLNKFSNRFNHSVRWAIIAGFGATLASIFAAPLFGIGGSMVKPILEIVNISSSPLLGYETHHSQKTRLELQSIYH